MKRDVILDGFIQQSPYLKSPPKEDFNRLMDTACSADALALLKLIGALSKTGGYDQKSIRLREETFDIAMKRAQELSESGRMSPIYAIEFFQKIETEKSNYSSAVSPSLRKAEISLIKVIEEGASSVHMFSMGTYGRANFASFAVDLIGFSSGNKELDEIAGRLKAKLNIMLARK